MNPKIKAGLCISFFLLSVQLMQGQVVKIENGISFSRLKSGPVNWGTLKHYQVAVGIDYLDHSWFNLSSNVGYFRKGSGEKISIYNEGGDAPIGYLTLHADYLTFNTTFQVKKKFTQGEVYIGAGPRLDVKVKDDELTDDFETLIAGLKCEAGVNYYLTQKVRVGLNAAWLPNFNKVQGDYKERLFTAGVSIGYVLK